MSDPPDFHSSGRAYTTGSVTSPDGTSIGYRQLGAGPGIVAVHGGMQAAQNFMKLAGCLADAFTVYLPDRRGRGRSGPPGPGYGLKVECDDLEALMGTTGSHYVFGLSSGALIALQAALTSTAVHKVALYEPPLSIDRSVPTDWGGRFDDEVARGDLVSAMVTVMKGTNSAPLAFRVMPRSLLVRLMRAATAGGGRSVGEGDIPLSELIPTMRCDHQLVLEAAGSLATFVNVPAQVLLLGGSRSARFLKVALDGLSTTLPHSRRVELPRVGHLAADNDGKPALVARELRRFFS
jgi:pimeloyl-ACP methyl ester carboxylesterase